MRQGLKWGHLRLVCSPYLGTGRSPLLNGTIPPLTHANQKPGVMVFFGLLPWTQLSVRHLGLPFPDDSWFELCWLKILTLLSTARLCPRNPVPSVHSPSSRDRTKSLRLVSSVALTQKARTFLTRLLFPSPASFLLPQRRVLYL